jgi:hypothetical protein
VSIIPCAWTCSLRNNLYKSSKFIRRSPQHLRPRRRVIREKVRAKPKLRCSCRRSCRTRTSVAGHQGLGQAARTIAGCVLVGKSALELHNNRQNVGPAQHCGQADRQFLGRAIFSGRRALDFRDLFNDPPARRGVASPSVSQNHLAVTAV